MSKERFNGIVKPRRIFYEKKSVGELRTLCAHAGLDVEGNKAALALSLAEDEVRGRYRSLTIWEHGRQIWPLPSPPIAPVPIPPWVASGSSSSNRAPSPRVEDPATESQIAYIAGLCRRNHLECPSVVLTDKWKASEWISFHKAAGYK